MFTFVVSASTRSDDTICGLLKRVTPKNDTPEGYQLALNVTCTPYGAGRRNYCWEWKVSPFDHSPVLNESLHLPLHLKNDSGYTCLKRWKTCLKSAFARVSYDLKKVVPVTDHKDYSVIFVRAFKNTTSSTDSYDDGMFRLQQYIACGCGGGGMVLASTVASYVAWICPQSSQYLRDLCTKY